MRSRIKQTIQPVNPGIAIERTNAMESLMAESVWRRRLWGAILAVFAGLARLMALAGRFGAMSYLVARQRQENGIRLAIGAGRGRVLRWVPRRGTILAGARLIAGLALSLGSLFSGPWFGIPPHDLATLAAVSTAVIATAMLACLLPAARAASVDPINAPREE